MRFFNGYRSPKGRLTFPGHIRKSADCGHLVLAWWLVMTFTESVYHTGITPLCELLGLLPGNSPGVSSLYPSICYSFCLLIVLTIIHCAQFTKGGYRSCGNVSGDFSSHPLFRILRSAMLPGTVNTETLQKKINRKQGKL